MHYSSSLNPPIDGCLDGGTLRFYRRSSVGSTHDLVNAQREDLSALDRQAVEEMYSEGFGGAMAFGTSTATVFATSPSERLAAGALEGVMCGSSAAARAVRRPCGRA